MPGSRTRLIRIIAGAVACMIFISCACCSPTISSPKTPQPANTLDVTAQVSVSNQSPDADVFAAFFQFGKELEFAAGEKVECDGQPLPFESNILYSIFSTLNGGYHGLVPKLPKGQAYRFTYTPGGSLPAATLKVPVPFETFPIIAPTPGTTLSLRQPLVIQLGPGPIPQGSVDITLEDASHYQYPPITYDAASSITIPASQLAETITPPPPPTPLPGQPAAPPPHQFAPGSGALDLTLTIDTHPATSAFAAAETKYIIADSIPVTWTT